MSINDFEIIKQIGSGAFSTVSLVKNKKDNKLYALKRVELSKMMSNEKDNSLNDIERNYWFREPLNFQKIVIQEHRNTISALRFLHKDSHFLFSSGFDKFIIIWKLDENSLTAECMRKIPARQEITDMKLFPDDKYLLVGYINGEINIYFCDYKNNSFTLSGTFLEHDDFLNSIALSPNIINDGLFASLSDKGKLILNEGSFYDGDFYDNQIHGKGKFLWSDGKEYNGEFKNNKMDGEGEFKYEDGKIYKGHFLRDDKNGYGELFQPNGKVYKGYWKNGKQNGEGEFYNPETNETKKGIWENGKRIKWLSE